MPSKAIDQSKLSVIHHVTINVADIEKSIKWYLSSFSCELIGQERTSATLRFANLSLTLCLPSESPAHLAFLRDDAATLGELRHRAEGLSSTFVADPTGNVIEVGVLKV